MTLLPMWELHHFSDDNQDITDEGMKISSRPKIKVMSYNILLPNSQDGWWNYKMYDPRIEGVQQASQWAARKNLLKDQIEAANPDILCLQEVSPLSFHSDFAFLQELGFDECFMHNKGRFRPATFFKSNKVSLVFPQRAKDRCIVSLFKELSCGSVFCVVNNHLQAGRDTSRRLRQIHEGVDAARKEFNKIKMTDLSDAKIMVCGDFNDETKSSAVGTFLETCMYRGDLSGKAKSHPFHPFHDSYAHDPKSTMVVANLIPLLGADSVSDLLKLKLESAFRRLANESDNAPLQSVRLNQQQIEEFLKKINGEVGRGSEFRTATEFMQQNPDKCLTMNDFLQLYERELQNGKYWGVFSDLYALGEELELEGRFQARYDYFYTSSFQISAILTTPQLESNEILPSLRHPSDHLPTGVEVYV